MGGSPSEALSRAEPARRAGPVRRILGWVGIALAFGVVLELTCRLEDWVMFRTPILSRVSSLDDLVVRDADGMHARPATQFQKWKVNSLGLRGPEVPVIPSAGTFRVVTVGASETFGLRESSGREYPRQLEDSLRAGRVHGQCGPSSRVQFEVLNAAFAGMSLPTIEQDVRLRLRRLRPKVIVVYPAPAQYLDDEMPHAATPDSGAPREQPSLARALKPRVVSRVRDQVKQMLPGPILTRLRNRETAAELRNHGPGWRFTGLPEERLAQFDVDLRRLLGTIRSIGAEPVLATHANLFMGREAIDRDMLASWEKFYPRAPGPVLVAFDSAARILTIRAGADSGVVTIDPATRLAKAPSTMFADFVHFTDGGAGIMASTLAPGVLAAAREQGVCGAASADADARR
jgi:hypothetical protein